MSARGRGRVIPSRPEADPARRYSRAAKAELSPRKPEVRLN